MPVTAFPPARAAAGPREHRGLDVERGHAMARQRERDAQATAAGRELDDGSAGALREREVELEVAGILDQVDVVEPRECLGLGVASARRAGHAGCLSPPSGRRCRRPS
ncbi:MAG: hypothetical protein L0221_13635 [Chloroflexi bacterium]|nr:hypothetical protein [Chloroflexota bacterium]